MRDEAVVVVPGFRTVWVGFVGLTLVASVAPPADAGKDDLPPVQAVAIGDFDGDGRADIAVGLPEEKVGKLKKAGEVRVYSGATGKFIGSLAGREAEEEYGGAMAAIGDFDGDGATDLAIGSPWSESRVRVDYVSGKSLTVHHTFPGGAAPALGTEVVAVGDGSGTKVVDTLLKDAISQRWYYAITGMHAGVGRNDDDQNSVMSDAAWVGDVNGDGVDDVAITNFFEDVGELESAGRIRVLSGKALSRSQGDNDLWTVRGTAENEYLGMHVGPAGDWNGDGAGDVLTGTSGNSDEKDGAWRVRVLSGKDGSQLWERRGEAGDISIGGAVLVGDLDGDGTNDIATSHPGRDKKSGAVQVLSGKDETVLWTIEGAAKEMLGEDLYACPDADGDGMRDLVLVSPGAKLERKKGNGYVRIVSGKTGATLTVINPLSKK